MEENQEKSGYFAGYHGGLVDEGNEARFFSLFFRDFAHGLMYEHAMEKEPGREVSLEIKEGESSSDVAAQLEKLGLIDNKESFMLKAKLYHASLLPGTYSLNTAMTQVDILDFISEEGKKNQELSDKKLLQEGDTESSLKEEDFSAGNEGD